MTRTPRLEAMGVFAACLACWPASPRTAVGVASAAALTETLDQVIQLDGLDLFLHCDGVGTPLVVFESGLGLGASHWQNVQADVARQTRACAYDRAGRGQSSPAPSPHSLEQMAAELHALLERAGQVGPFVLVGHAMGAGLVRWFELQHSDLVAGMVLIDPATAPALEDVFASASAEALAEYEHKLREVEGLDRQAYLRGLEGLRASAQALGERPLLVLTAGQPEATLESRQGLRAEISLLSSDSVRVVAEKSGQDIVIDEPTLVSRSVLSVVQAVRRHEPIKVVWASQIRESADE